MIYRYKILIVLFFNFLLSQENWNMTITADDIESLGSSDQIILGMCQDCQDTFLYGEDEYDIPPPPGYYTDISFFNFDWVGISDQNGVICDNPEFYIDKKSFHEPVDLLIWEIAGLTNLSDDSSNLQLSWVMEDLDLDYEIFLYIGNSSYNMRNISNVVITQNQLEVSYDPLTGMFMPNIRIVIGGCAESGDITEYYYDQDGDGFGFGSMVEFCTGKQPDGWVANDNDINDEVYCLSNTIDECGDCDGENLCLGCSDISACNYSDLVTTDDGSCYYVEEYYNCDGSCILDSDGDNVCDDLETFGCTDMTACNYNSDATEDDGSCEYPEEYYDCNGNCISDSDEDNVCDEFEILGCTNPESCLYDSSATEYDGSCCFENDSSCIEAPGQIENFNIQVNLNSATIDFEQPCGVSNVWIYRLLENLNDAGVVIPSPYTIENLGWGESYTYYLKTINSAGYSITEINFTTNDQPLPDQVEIVNYDIGEAQVSLEWMPVDNVDVYNIIKDDIIVDVVNNVNNSYVDYEVFYYPGVYYNYQVQAVNSQGNLGTPSSSIQIQPDPIPSVENLISSSGPGSIVFSWESPDSYANSSIYSFKLTFEDMSSIEIYENVYTMSNLIFDEEICLTVQAIHQYGESNLEVLCDFPQMPPPPPISNFTATGNEGYVSLSWSVFEEPNHLVNIYRDQQLILSNLNTIENPPPYINDIYDGYGMLAGQLYSYQISALNSDFLEGEISDPIIASTPPLPVVSDLSAESGDGRVILSWSDLEDYAGFGYDYEIIDENNEIISETNNSYATISNLSAGQEYCFRVIGNSIGGYGVSAESNEVCAIPQDVFDGTEGDNNIDWGIQLSLSLSVPGGDILLDTQNMLGVALDATDDCDSTYDIAELTDTPNIWAKLHFPHQDWDCALVSGSKYNNDIRSTYSDPSEIKEWDVQLETNSWSDGIATVSFYFYEEAGGNTAYYTLDNTNYVKINNGDQIEYGIINPVLPGAFKVIVGNIIPMAPVNLVTNSGYREIELSWSDGYIPGSLSYESSSYNIYRNNELIGTTSNLHFIDRSLDFSTEYKYEISGVNIAGEGEKSVEIYSTTLDDRPPVANAGIDLIIYDFENDNIENSQFSLPMNIGDNPSNLLFLDNISWDPDNYFDGGIYNPPLDQLNYFWSSSNSSSNSNIYNAESNGYGFKIFVLEVNDGYLSSEINDSVSVKVVPLPAPAKVYVDTSYSGLYSIDIEWLESNYTGEPFIKLDVNSDISVFEDGDSYEDVNGNGVYDSGLDPLPPFYGLSNLNNSEGFKNIADYYEVELDGFVLDQIINPCDTNPEDIYLDEFCYSITGLEPSTNYSIIVKSCNFNNECSNSDPINISTGNAPYAEVISPNGAEIIGIDEGLNIELDFGSGTRYVDSLFLSVLIDENSIWDTTIFTSTTQSIIDNSYILPINNFEYNSTLNPNSKIEIAIVDEGGVDYFSNPEYHDVSDEDFIITSNTINQEFDSGWHLIGTPVILDTDVTMQSHINNGTTFNNGINYWQIIDEYEGVTDPISPSDQIFNSGQGYYLNLYSINPQSENFSEELSLSGNVVSEYTINNLHIGWNLISNPLVISMNINNIDIIHANGDVMNWGEANEQGLIGPYLLELNHENNTLFPSYEIQPYKGYWVYLNEEVDIYFKSEVQQEEDLSANLSSTDFIINLSSRAFGQGASSFGSSIQLGYGLNTSNDFINGVDIPYLEYQYFSEYTSMYINHIDEDWNSDYDKLSRDIREHYQPSYVWNIKGIQQAIYDPVNNPYTEIELFWDISDIDSNYVVILEYGEGFAGQTNMQELNYVKLNSDQFENMRVIIELQDYYSGCSELTACNYFCVEKPWECPNGNLPANFVDDNSCDLTSCVGCMDSSASNFNPNATIDSICNGGEYNGFSCMDAADVCGVGGVCTEQICEYNESYQFPSADKKIYVEDSLINKVPIYLNNYDNVPVYGVEIELLFDNSVIDVSSVQASDLSISNSILDGYTSLSYVDSDGTFYFVAYSASPILSGGLLFELEVDAIGEVGDTTSIVFDKAVLNDDQISSNNLNLILSEGALDVFGDINYYSNTSFPIGATEFSLIGYSEYNNPYGPTTIDTISSVSSNSGEYIFEAALRGNYIMQASKFEVPGSDDGLSAVDASRIARYLIDLIDFNEDQLIAADVDMNGNISAVDAAFIARYLIGLVDQLNIFNQHWRFRGAEDFYFNITDNLDYELSIYDLRPLESNLDTQDIIGIRIGDVDGSWISDAQSRNSTIDNNMDMHVNSNEILSIPIAISEQQAIEGVEIVINYDDEKLFFNNFELMGDITSYNLMINDLTPGELSLIAYSSSSIENVDNIFGEISFDILDKEMSNSIIALNKILINGKNVSSGFLVFDDGVNEYIYSRQLSVSSTSHPEQFELGDCYPNPFNPTAQIPFSIPIDSNVEITIFDISGRFVAKVLSSNLRAGTHSAKLNGKNLASGVYIVKMHATSLSGNKSFSQSKKALLLK